MARKKKEEIKEQPEAVVTEPALEQETPKKTVKRARTTKKPSLKQTKETVQTETVENASSVEETAHKQNEEKTVEKVKKVETVEKIEKPQKPKRVKKPVTKEKATVTVDDKTEKGTAPIAPAPVATETKEEVKKTVTRAEKNETIKLLVKELLSKRPYKWSELLDESAKLYAERIEEKDGHVANDVRGRVGSVFDVMKKDGEVVFEGGMYALKKLETLALPEKAPVLEERTEKAEKNTEKQSVVAEISAPAPAVATEKSEKVEEKKEKQLPVVKKKAEIAPVFDMTALLVGKNDKNDKNDKTTETQKEQKPAQTLEEKTTAMVKRTEDRKPEVKKTEPKKAESKRTETPKEDKQLKRVTERRSHKTSEEKLRELFLKKIRALGGKYFEYYSIYLLERYSLRNGRRVDGFKISGGDNDGGIDGELEVTDRIGFKETIYVQAKNWKPIYGKEDSWVIGETALREFIGAVAYRQAKEGKQRCRGIFITTSYFTAGSKEILEKMSDQFVGYDGNDLFEAAKECSFGLVQENGEWKLDEKLFVGEKAFFNLYE